MAAFHRRCGQNIRLTKENTVARRVDSYNQGVVYSAEPLELGEVFSVRIDEKEGGWAGGFVRKMFGEECLPFGRL